jgi:hypothetical protein
MGERLTDQVRKALELLPLPRFAEGGTRAYETIRAYAYGKREPTPEAAREIAAYLRSRAEEFAQVAEELEAAADAEES